jgi:small-conductance mechanosensitive channel
LRNADASFPLYSREISMFYGETFSVWLANTLAWLLSDVFTPINVVYTAMQIPAVVGTGFGAWWVHDFLHPLVAERIKRSPAHDYPRLILLTLASVIFPVLWGLALWVSAGVAVHFGWPFNLVRIAINLVAAWIVIRLASIVVRDPIWSRMIVVVAYTVAVLNILDLLNPTLALLGGSAIKIGNVRVSLLTILQGMLTLGALLWVAIIVSGILERRIQKLPNLTPSIQVLIGKLFKVTLVTVAVVVALGSVGIDLTAIAVFSGAVGVGIGFGLQKVVSNLISGIIILMDKSIKPGDIIQIGETYGWVSALGARYVSIETRDRTEFLVPNEDIVTKQVINWTHRDDVVRLKVKVRVSYKADLQQALRLMVQATAKLERVLKEPEPRAIVIGFGESAIDLELRFWIKDVQGGIRNISSEVLLNIWQLFQEHGIAIPLPQRDIHIQSIPAAAMASLGRASEALSSKPGPSELAQPGPISPQPAG